MSTLPLGVGAYKRASFGNPEVELLNRFAEKNPANLREHVSLLARPGTKLLGYFPATSGGKYRASSTQLGVFNDDLFVVSGENLWRYSADKARTHIIGVVNGTSAPSICYAKGPGYQQMFIADGLLLQYYSGGTKATASLTTNVLTGFDGAQIAIDGVYYGWTTGDLEAKNPIGAKDRPFLCLVGDTHQKSLANMANMLNFEGGRGVDFSKALTTFNVDVSARQADIILHLTSRTDTTDGNLITVSSTTDQLPWSSPTLQGGGMHVLHGVVVPNGQPVIACAYLNGYVFVALGGSRRMYFIKPGETTIDPLLFATKESAPDNIVDLKRVGDVMAVMGSKSIEFWAATGNADAPFAPVQGRTLSRGIIAGTAVTIDENTLVAVGNDMKVYSIQGSPARISDHGIEERIRKQVLREGV